MTWGTYLAVIAVIAVWRVIDHLRSRTEGGPPVKRADISGFTATLPASEPRSQATDVAGATGPVAVPESPVG